MLLFNLKDSNMTRENLKFSSFEERHGETVLVDYNQRLISELPVDLQALGFETFELWILSAAKV